MKTEAQYIAENIELKERNQKLEAELFLANSKLEECNRIIQELQEKLNIRTARLFSPKTETEKSMQIDEAEGILEEEKKERKANEQGQEAKAEIFGRRTGEKSEQDHLHRTGRKGLPDMRKRACRGVRVRFL